MNTERKERLTNLMKKYVSKGNIIDISAFRKDNPNEYALLSHYFGSVNNAIEDNGWVKVQTRTKGKKVTLKNQLAFMALEKMRKDEKKTLEEIADMTGVSRAAVNQMHNALRKMIDEDKE